MAYGDLTKPLKISFEEAETSNLSFEKKCDSPTRRRQKFEANAKFDLMIRSLSKPQSPSRESVKAFDRQLRSLDDIYWATDEMRKLTVNDHEIKAISLDFFAKQFPKTQTAVLSENQIDALEEVSSFDPNNPPALERLFLDSNRLLKLPESISIFFNLKSLTLGHNLLDELHESIGTLSNLTTLILSYNFLHRLPKSITDLKHLQRLDISFNCIANLPENLTNLGNLREFLCAGNKLETIPESFFNLEQLETVNLNWNLITELPKHFASHLKIEKFCCEFNQLKVLPAWLFEKFCPKLRVLALTSNQLTEFFRNLPDDVAEHWPLLQELYIAGNSISGPLPKAIRSFNQMRKLQLEARPLYESDNMRQFFETVNAFTGDQISAVSENVGGFGRLPEEPIFQHLEDFLPSVIFKDPTDGFMNFGLLTELYLCSQGMTKIPDCILELNALAVLDVSYNRITEIRPDTIGWLDGLKTLDASANSIEKIAWSDFEYLHNLQHLYLSDNLLSELPEEVWDVWNLPELHELDVGQNELTKLPKTLEKRRNQICITVNENPLCPEAAEIWFPRQPSTIELPECPRHGIVMFENKRMLEFAEEHGIQIAQFRQLGHPEYISAIVAGAPALRFGKKVDSINSESRELIFADSPDDKTPPLPEIDDLVCRVFYLPPHQVFFPQFRHWPPHCNRRSLVKKRPPKPDSPNWWHDAPHDLSPYVNGRTMFEPKNSWQLYRF